MNNVKAFNLILENITLFDEATKLLEEELSEIFFKKLDRHIKEFFDQQKNWEGRYDFWGQYLHFAPSKWNYQKCKEFDYTKYFARYVMTSEKIVIDSETTNYWVTRFFENNENDRMVFAFYNWRANFYNCYKKEWKNFLREQEDIYPEILGAGFKYIASEGGWYLPIKPLNPRKVIEAFKNDDFEEAFQPITDALETIIKTNKYFDKIVKSAIKHFGQAN